VDEEDAKKRVLSVMAQIQDDTKALRRGKFKAAVLELGDWVQIEDLRERER